MTIDVAYPGVGAVAHRATIRHPDRIAFRCGSESTTYREVGALIRRGVGVLSAAELAPGAPIMQITGNLVQAFALQMSAYLTGHPSVMLHAKVGAADRLRVLTDADPGMVVVDPDVLSAGGDSLSSELDRPCYSHGATTDLVDFWSLPQSEPDRTNGPKAEDIARIAYTGGTTGSPKGVLLSQRAMFAATMISTCEMEWPDDPQFIVATPITHAGGTLIPSVLALGGTVHLHKTFDAEAVVHDIVEGADSVFLVPTMMYVVLDLLEARPARVSGLKMLLYGASSISAGRLQQALDVFGPVLNQSYGQTEAPNTITILKADEHRPELLASSGLPYAGVTVVILDADGQEVPTGTIGEICVRGPQLMTGYRGLPDATAQALRDGWLWTGDRGYVDEQGYVFHNGRSKDVIISGGYNIYPSEIEAVLDSDPDVLQSVVVGVPDDHWGEAVKAVVVRRAGVTTEGDLRALVRSRKGPMLVPKSFEFVESMPLTALGKPDRVRIREQFSSTAGTGS
jgi:fatty-acyl-CoA synthase